MTCDDRFFLKAFAELLKHDHEDQLAWFCPGPKTLPPLAAVLKSSQTVKVRMSISDESICYLGIFVFYSDAIHDACLAYKRALIMEPESIKARL